MKSPKVSRNESARHVKIRVYLPESSQIGYFVSVDHSTSYNSHVQRSLIPDPPVSQYPCVRIIITVPTGNVKPNKDRYIATTWGARLVREGRDNRHAVPGQSVDHYYAE